MGHAIAAGELLIEAKGKVRHGQWLKWLAAHKFPQRTATHYMELARRRDDLCDQNGKVLPISVNKALHMLKWPYYGSGGPHEFENEYEPYRGWGCSAWGQPFNHALKAITFITECYPPAPRYVVRATRQGKTPGLNAPVLRAAIALLTGYADALENAQGGVEEVIADPVASASEACALMHQVVAWLYNWSSADERRRFKIIQIIEHVGRLIEQHAREISGPSPKMPDYLVKPKLQSIEWSLDG